MSTTGMETRLCAQTEHHALSHPSIDYRSGRNSVCAKASPGHHSSLWRNYTTELNAMKTTAFPPPTWPTDSICSQGSEGHAQSASKTQPAVLSSRNAPLLSDKRKQ